MDESYILITCLQNGPIDTTKWAPSWHVDASQLPPHPWSNETIRDLADRYPMIDLKIVTLIGNLTPRTSHSSYTTFNQDLIYIYGVKIYLLW